MNNIAITPYIALYALQIHNVKRDVAKKVSINELNNTEIIIPNNEQNANAQTENNIVDTSDIKTIQEPASINASTMGSEIN